MRAKVRLLRRDGRVLLKKDVESSPARMGMLVVSDVRHLPWERNVRCARLVDIQNGTEMDVVPRLLDARLLWVQEGHMRLTGLEPGAEGDHAQTWLVELS